MMFIGREGQRPILRARPINHADMLMRLADAVDVQEPWSNQGARAGARGGRSFAEQFHVESALLSRFAQGGLLRILIQFNVPAQRQPLVQLAMVNQQNFALVNDKDRHGEVYLFMNVSNVSHSTPTFRGRFPNVNSKSCCRPRFWYVSIVKTFW